MLRTVGILVVGAIVGWLAALVGIPLPWLIGPLVATATIALFGVQLKPPPLIRKIGQCVAATAIGMSFSPEIVETLAGYVDVMIVTAAGSMLASILIARLTSKIAHISFQTAYFACLPGGVVEMSVLAERYGGETALVALAQSLRIILVVLSIPVAIVALSAAADEAAYAATAPQQIDLLALAIMMAAAFALGTAFERVRLMNAWFLAGLVVGAGVALLELPASHVPFEMVDAAQVMIGCALGARIDRAIIVRLRHFLPATIMSTALLILFNVGMAWLACKWTGIDLPALVLALAPGGVAEMSITAKALHLAVPLVTAFHLVRVLMIILCSAPVYRGAVWIGARLTDRQPAE